MDVRVRPPIPVVLKAVAELAATESEDGVGTFDRPDHTRLFQPGSVDGFAPRIDDAGAGEKALRAKRRITHAVLVLVEGGGLNA